MVTNWLLGDDNTDFGGLNPQVYAAAVRAAEAYGQPLSVISAFRSPEYQAQLRAANPQATAAGRIARDSQHSHGNALDFSTVGMAPEDIARMAGLLADAGFSAFGQYGDHLHADYRGVVPGSFGVNSPTWGGWTELDPQVMQALQGRGFQAGQPWAPVGNSGGDRLMEGQMPQNFDQVVIDLLTRGGAPMPFVQGPDQRYFGPPAAGPETLGLEHILGLPPGSLAQAPTPMAPGQTANPMAAAATGEPGLPPLPQPVGASAEGGGLDPFAMYAAALSQPQSMTIGSPIALPVAPGQAAAPAGPDFSAIRQLLAQAAPSTEPAAPDDQWLRYILGAAAGGLAQPSDDIGAIIGGAGAGALGGFLDANMMADEENRQIQERFRDYLLGMASAETGLVGAESNAAFQASQLQQQGLDSSYSHQLRMFEALQPNVDISDGQLVVSGLQPDGTQRIDVQSLIPTTANDPLQRMYAEVGGRLAATGSVNIMRFAEELEAAGVIPEGEFQDRTSEVAGMATGDQDSEEVAQFLAQALMSYVRNDPQALGLVMAGVGFGTGAP